MLRRGEEIVTFVARNLEPLRGYHSFMRALPPVLAARPKARVLIVGGDGVSYGAAAPPGTTWKATYLDEVKDGLDLSRVHFLGPLDYLQYLAVLKVSAVHLYLTYPFVLSWSMLEAMSCGCLVLGADVPPVREVIDGTNGIIVPLFEPGRIAAAAIDALAFPASHDDKRTRARATVLARYDLQQVCLPAALALLAPA